MPTPRKIKKLDAAGAMPGGNNTSPPGFGPKRKTAQELLDLDKFVPVEGIAVFSTDYAPGTTVDDLDELIANTNRRARRTGDLSPLIFGEGHTDERPNSDRPVKGYAHNFRLGELADGTPCIDADFLIRSEFYDEAKLYPRRSVEMWKADEGFEGASFDALALLGGTTPALDLGLMVLDGRGAASKSGLKLVRCELRQTKAWFDKGNETMSLDLSKEDLIQLIQNCINEAPTTKYVAQLQEREQAELDPVENEETEDTGKSQDPPANEGDEPEKQDAECDEDMPPKKESKSKLSKTDRLEIERNDARLELDRFKKQSEAQQSQLDAINKKLRKSDRQGELERLRFEGFAFELADELEYCLDLSDEQYAKHVGKIKTRYQKAPLGYAPVNTMDLEQAVGGVGAKVERLSRAAGNNDADARKEWLQTFRKASDYAAKNKCSFEDALTKVS